MPDRSRKRPRNMNGLARLIVDEATADEKPPNAQERVKDPAVVSLGRRGGLKGVWAMAESLSASTLPGR